MSSVAAAGIALSDVKIRWFLFRFVIERCKAFPPEHNEFRCDDGNIGGRLVPHLGRLSMMCLGMFMAILDIQVVATSLPTIQRALNIAPDEMSWIQTAYLIAEIISIP